MRWLTNFYDFRFKWTAIAAIAIHLTKAWLSTAFENSLWTWGHLRRTICNKNSVFNLEKMPQKTYGMLSDCFWSILHESSFSFLSGIRDSRKAGSLWGMMRGLGGVRKSIHHSWLAKGLGLGLGLLRWGFKGVQEKDSIRRGQFLFKSGQWHFQPGQCTSPTTPSLSQTIWPRWASRQFVTLPIVQTLVPVTFGYSLSYETIE